MYVSGAVRPLKWPLSVKWLIYCQVRSWPDKFFDIKQNFKKYLDCLSIVVSRRFSRALTFESVLCM